MDRIERYRQCIRHLLTQYSKYGEEEGIETQLVFDSESDRYLLLRVGWEDQQRIHYCVFHFDIKDGKIWLQENNTDIEVDKDLEEIGISKKEVVVGFHHPLMRPHSDFAVA